MWKKGISEEGFERIAQSGVERNENKSDFLSPKAWEISEDGKMTVGAPYDTDELDLLGWTEGDGSGSDGYNIYDYFRNGLYIGPDEHGIEPIVEAKDEDFDEGF
jgi:hypothetical protein